MSLVQGRKRSDYDWGWTYFMAGQSLPANASRPMVDGYNRCRAEAIKFNDSMNKHRGYNWRRGTSMPKEEYRSSGAMSDDELTMRMRSMHNMQEWYRGVKGSRVRVAPIDDNRCRDVSAEQVASDWKEELARITVRKQA